MKTPKTNCFNGGKGEYNTDDNLQMRNVPAAIKATRLQQNSLPLITISCDFPYVHPKNFKTVVNAMESQHLIVIWASKSLISHEGGIVRLEICTLAKCKVIFLTASSHHYAEPQDRLTKRYQKWDDSRLGPRRAGPPPPSSRSHPATPSCHLSTGNCACVCVATLLASTMTFVTVVTSKC